jgi:translation initiation factor 3 subunit B
MGLQGKRSIKMEGVVDFEWCPHGDGGDAEKVGIDGSKVRGTRWLFSIYP